MSFAKAFVTGVVTKTPEKRFTQNDMAIVGFTVALDDNQESLVRVVAFGTQADTISSTINQGDRVAIDGSLQINTFKTPSGKDRKVFEINASAVEKIGGLNSNANNASSSNNKQENIVSFNNDEIAQDLIDEDEIPF